MSRNLTANEVRQVLTDVNAILKPHMSFTINDIRTKWEINNDAKSYCKRIFLRMWEKQTFVANLTIPRDIFVAYGSKWKLVYDDEVSKLLLADHIGLSFRVLPNGERYVIVKVWTKKERYKMPDMKLSTNPQIDRSED